MAQTLYTYSIADDTLNGIVKVGRLGEEIAASDIVTALDYINSADDSIHIYFKDSLSGGDETILDAIVSAHEGVPGATDPTAINAAISSMPPFAEPDYRTKRSATDAWASLTESDTEIIDYLLTEERYVSGGEVIYKDAKQGDYITAEVYDTDGVIPAPYRAALCEAHPSVATYIVKKWLKPCSGYDSFMIDTYPLNAKLSAGLYLRVTYHSSSVAGTRELAVNYHLTKKLV